MTPEEIRNFVDANPQYHPESTTALMLQEIAAQLAEANQYLKLLAYPVRTFQCGSGEMGTLYWSKDSDPEVYLEPQPEPTKPILATVTNDADPVGHDDAPRAEQRWGPNGSSMWCVIDGDRVLPFGSEDGAIYAAKLTREELVSYSETTYFTFKTDPTVKDPEPAPFDDIPF